MRKNCLKDDSFILCQSVLEKGRKKKDLKGEEVQVHPGIKNRACLAYIHRDIC